jgi:hypothetical protein
MATSRMPSPPSEVEQRMAALANEWGGYLQRAEEQKLQAREMIRRAQHVFDRAAEVGKPPTFGERRT